MSNCYNGYMVTTKTTSTTCINISDISNWAINWPIRMSQAPQSPAKILFSPQDDLDLIVSNVLLFFFAGFETTSIGFSVVCHKLALFPELQATACIDT